MDVVNATGQDFVALKSLCLLVVEKIVPNAEKGQKFRRLKYESPQLQCLRSTVGGFEWNFVGSRVFLILAQGCS